ncbi:uncharacterized protein MONOS_7575 [Monocercomonoides exilis]|uniref:uncharacterized protein n=1 Tax=Monocercomonoides exilis TaxID=2049356 RepID=UPI0035597E79|nr:hypothetical protein MONOS_7575 [Monocercomonoides exilis]|eukprot:MONOS_7575.1-p1 / transcript=MONOS_7575.1 / gene=MONOS_7575 / organism=Monocercomonoides_exilis_PA203 / gene_product=unspecified product / transcript_product=unspecified product / location=Mono_scaffold00262:15034-15531(-) / protein_length=131 / sequence_SO=supercontig / SO=protein_coding / is_pseudo=false
MEQDNQEMEAESKRRQSRSNDAVEVKEIGEIPNVIHGVVIPGWKIGYCSIKSFSVSAKEDFSKFVQIVVNVVQEAKHYNFKMALDVRGNKGRSIILYSETSLLTDYKALDDIDKRLKVCEKTVMPPLAKE